MGGKADAEQGGGDQPLERRGCGRRARPGVAARAQGARGQPCSPPIMAGQAVAGAAGLLALVVLAVQVGANQHRS